MIARTAVGMVIAAMVLAPGLAGAQSPVLNPTTVEFDPSPDHSATGSDGQPVVQRYELQMYPRGSSQLAMAADLGKPAPGGDGKIRVDFSTRLTPWPPPNGEYDARVAAVGPGGAGQSDSSNPFTYAAVIACSYALSASSAALVASGGTASVTLTTASGCQWAVSGVPSWLTSGTVAGTGTATLAFTASSNSSTTARTASLTIAGRSYTVTQAGACAYTLSSAAATVPAGGGATSVTLTTGSACGWTVTGAPSWATVSTTSGSGNATLTFTAVPNTAQSARAASIAVGGRTFALSQEAAACASVLSPASVVVGGSGGMGTVSITASSGCSWRATAGAAWITLNTTAGTGPANVSFSVAKNTTGVARVGTIAAGGTSTTITQGVLGSPSRPGKVRVSIVGQ